MHKSLLQVSSSASLRVYTPAIPTTLRTSSLGKDEVSVRLSKRLPGVHVAIAAILDPCVLVAGIVIT
jgi:hypothetical protein